MITFPLVRAVAAPTPDAEVLYDFCDSTMPGVETYVERDGFSIGVPQLLGDPDALGVDWGLRLLKIPQVIEGSKAAALACQSRLARVLMRRRYWLMVQLDATSTPVWWHAYLSQPGEVSFDSVYVDDHDAIVPAGTPGSEPLPDMWQISVQVDAVPFGYLERRSLPSVAIGNGLGGFDVALPPVAGDALSPLRIGVSGHTVDGIGNEIARWLFMVLHGAPVVRHLDIGTGDGATAGGSPWVVATAGGSNYSGGSYRQATFSAETAETVPRFYAQVPAGRYKVLLRVGFILTAESSTSTFRAGLTPATLTSVTPGMPGVPAGSEVIQVIELGEISAGVAGLPGDVASIESLITMEPVFSTNDTGLVVRLDAFTFVRIDDGQGATADSFAVTFDRGIYSGPAPLFNLDGDDEVTWNQNSTNSLAFNARATALTGSFPRLDPATENTLVALPLWSVSPVTMALSVAHDLTLSYPPQVLWLAEDPT